MPKLLQVLILVDVEGAVDRGELEAVLPDRRDERLVLSLLEHDAPRVVRHGPDAQPVDWLGLGRAIESVAQAVREASQERTLHLYVGGQGPLPVFTHLGYAVSKFNGPQWVVARRPGTPWELLPLADVSDAPYVLTAGDLPTRRSHATGQAGIYFDVAPRPMNVDVLRAAVDRCGDRLADAVELRPAQALAVDATNCAALAAELAARLTQIPALFPHRSALALFVAGPTFFAFAVGRGVNPTIVATATLFNFSEGAYDFVYALPFEDEGRPTIARDDASLADRTRVKQLLLAAVEELKLEVAEADLVGPLRDQERGAFLSHLASLRYQETQADEFSLCVAGGTFSFGEGLLEALRNGEPAMQQRFAKLLLLHELLHDHQGIRSTNYFDVGRAGVVLEAVDFVADVFAVHVAMKGTLRRLSSPTIEVVRAETTAWIDAVLYGIQAFDALEHGTRINRLADRRLRRYLTWHLQRVRAESVDTAADVATLLDSPVTAELAPVSARIDRRFDRQVIAATAATEFFAAVGGRLVRHSKRAGFDPTELVEAVRGFNTQAIQNAMRYVVGENRTALIPWRR